VPVGLWYSRNYHRQKEFCNLEMFGIELNQYMYRIFQSYSRNVSKCKKLFGSRLFQIFSLQVILLLILCSGLMQGFKGLTIFFFLFSIGASFILKDIFLGFFLMTIFSFQFFVPNKYYDVIVIPATAIDLLGFKDGYLIGYGLHIGNIMLGISFIIFLRKIFTVNKFLLRRFIYISWPILLGLLGFYCISVYSSNRFSPFSSLSIVWILQYSQLFYCALLLIYVQLFNKENFKYIFLTCGVSLIFQFGIALLQFIKQSTVGLPIEASYGSFFGFGLDENNALFRVQGTFMFHNQLGLINLLLSIIIIPAIFRNRKRLYIIPLFFSLLTTILTQSRSVMVGTVFLVYFMTKVYTLELKQIIHWIGVRRLFIYGTLLCLSLSYVLIPRLLLTANTLYTGAGTPVRLELLSEGFDAFMQNIWLGYGVGTNEYTLYSLFPNGIIRTFPAAIHFALLQLGLEIGMIGVLFFLFPFLWIFRKSLIYFAKASRDYKFVFWMGSIAIIVYYSILPHVGMFEFPYVGLVLGFGYISIYEIFT
jgi:hypothetical protein